MGKSQSTQRSSTYGDSSQRSADAVQQRSKKTGSRTSTLERPVSSVSVDGAGLSVISSVPDPTKSNGSAVETSPIAVIPEPVAVAAAAAAVSVESNIAGDAVTVTASSDVTNIGSSVVLPPDTSTPTDISKAAQATAVTTSPVKSLTSDSTFSPTKYAHEALAVENYQKVVDQVILSWPDFVTLRKVNVEYIDPDALTTICDIFRRLIEQYQRIRALQDGSRDSVEELKKLREKCQETEQELIRRQKEIDSLKLAVVARNESASSLSTNRSTSVRQFPAADYDLDEVESDNSAPSPRQPAPIRPSSIYQPTAFVQAISQKAPEVVRQTAGARTSGYDAFGADQLLSSSYGQRQLEATLERERPKVSHSSVSLFQPRTRDPGPIVERYRRLEDEALGKLFTIVKSATPNRISDERQSSFICAIMEVAYTTALSTVGNLNDTILGLLKNPFRLGNDVSVRELVTSSQAELMTSNSAGVDRSSYNGEAVAGQVVLRHSSRIGRTPSKVTANPRDEAGLQEETLMKNVRCYMTNQADVINISTLVETVLRSLRRSFPDCTLPTNNSTFSRFVDECCRLAWQMSVADPQYYVTTDATPGRRFDKRLHDTLMQTATGDYQLIGHYLWPVLFDHRHGAVLSKGRVELEYGSSYGGGGEPSQWSNSRF